MPESATSKGGREPRRYVPYGLPYGFPFAPAYRWPYLPRQVPYYPYGAPFLGSYSPFGMPYTAETARKAELEALKAQAEYFEDMLKDIKDYIAELESEGQKKE